MHKKILLTSFQTWLPHQVSNSSDDLLAKIQDEAFLSASLTFLRQLPVDVLLASQKAIATIQVLQPHVVICCGKDYIIAFSNISDNLIPKVIAFGSIPFL
jgi:pyroglutamyl-peptidase